MSILCALGCFPHALVRALVFPRHPQKKTPPPPPAQHTQHKKNTGHKRTYYHYIIIYKKLYYGLLWFIMVFLYLNIFFWLKVIKIAILLW